MSTAPSYKLTEHEYLAKERLAEIKSEYYRGEVFPMPGCSRAHNLIVVNCVSELRTGLRGRHYEVYPSDMRVKVSTSGLYTYPDAVVVGNQPRFEDEQIDTLLNPLLLIEVLSDSTEKYDRGAKRDQYRTIPSLREIVLIAQDYPQVESLYRHEQGTWILREQKELQGSFFFESIQVSISLAEIYRQVQFAKSAEEFALEGRRSD